MVKSQVNLATPMVSRLLIGLLPPESCFVFPALHTFAGPQRVNSYPSQGQGLDMYLGVWCVTGTQ